MQIVATHPVKCGEHLWHPDTGRWTRLEPVYDEDTGMGAATADRMSDRAAIREFAAKHGGYKRNLLAKIFHDLRQWFELDAFQREWIEEVGGENTDTTRELKRLDRQITITKDRLDNKPMPENHITDEMIARARAHPIRELLQVNRQGQAIRCIYWRNHANRDAKPSMRVYDDGAYCPVCHVQIDAIDVIMEEGMSFPAAVRHLCGERGERR